MRIGPFEQRDRLLAGQHARVNGFIAQFATADGIAGVSPGRNIQFIPYGTFTGARFLD